MQRQSLGRFLPHILRLGHQSGLTGTAWRCFLRAKRCDGQGVSGFAAALQAAGTWRPRRRNGGHTDQVEPYRAGRPGRRVRPVYKPGQVATVTGSTRITITLPTTFRARVCGGQPSRFSILAAVLGWITGTGSIHHLDIDDQPGSRATFILRRSALCALAKIRRIEAAALSRPSRPRTGPIRRRRGSAPTPQFRGLDAPRGRRAGTVEASPRRGPSHVPGSVRRPLAVKPRAARCAARNLRGVRPHGRAAVAAGHRAAVVPRSSSARTPRVLGRRRLRRRVFGLATGAVPEQRGFPRPHRPAPALRAQRRRSGAKKPMKSQVAGPVSGLAAAIAGRRRLRDCAPRPTPRNAFLRPPSIGRRTR